MSDTQPTPPPLPASPTVSTTTAAVAPSDSLWTPQSVTGLIGMTIFGTMVFVVLMGGLADTIKSQTVGGVLMVGGAIIGYYFGSSSGSQKKDERAATTTTTTVATP